MRFSDYLAGLPADAQQALAEDLSLGAGWAAIAARDHDQNLSAAAQLGMLGTAYAALRAALEGLGEHDGPTTAPTMAPADHTLPAHWSALVTRAGEEMIRAWLQMAAEMARDAARAARQERM